MTVERHSFHQILRETPATLSVTFYQDGQAADPGEVTVTVAREDGTEIISNQTATAPGETGVRDMSLTTAETADLDLLTATWKSENLGTVTTKAEIVGDLLFTVDEARAFDNAALQDSSTYPASTILEARGRIGDAFEEICGVAFFPRYRRVVLSGTGERTILLPDIHVSNVRSIETREFGSQTWDAFDSDELADVLVEEHGTLIRESLGNFLRGTRNVRVGYEYGYERVPLEIRRAALVLLRDQAVASNVTDRATSQSSEFGEFRLATAGLTRGSYFGLPAVDSVLQRYMQDVPAIG